MSPRSLLQRLCRDRLPRRYVARLDTGRAAKFRWPELQLHSVPSLTNKEDLFRLSGKVRPPPPRSLRGPAHLH